MMRRMTITHPDGLIALRIDGGTNVLLKALTLDPNPSQGNSFETIEATISITKDEVSWLIEELGKLRDQLED